MYYSFIFYFFYYIKRKDTLYMTTFIRYIHVSLSVFHDWKIIPDFKLSSLTINLNILDKFTEWLTCLAWLPWSESVLTWVFLSGVVTGLTSGVEDFCRNALMVSASLEQIKQCKYNFKCNINCGKQKKKILDFTDMVNSNDQMKRKKKLHNDLHLDNPSSYSDED